MKLSEMDSGALRKKMARIKRILRERAESEVPRPVRLLYSSSTEDDVACLTVEFELQKDEDEDGFPYHRAAVSVRARSKVLPAPFAVAAVESALLAWKASASDKTWASNAVGPVRWDFSDGRSRCSADPRFGPPHGVDLAWGDLVKGVAYELNRRELWVKPPGSDVWSLESGVSLDNEDDDGIAHAVLTAGLSDDP